MSEKPISTHQDLSLSSETSAYSRITDGGVISPFNADIQRLDQNTSPYTSSGFYDSEGNFYNGEVQIVSNGAVASNTWITGPSLLWGTPGSNFQIVESGGTALNTVLSGAHTVRYNTQGEHYISATGIQIASSGAVISGDQIFQEGKSYIKNGATSTDAVLSGRSSSFMSAYTDYNQGRYVEVEVTSQWLAFQDVAGYSNSALIENAGLMTVDGTGTAANTIVSSGGTLSAQSGSHLLTTIVNSGATLILDSGSNIETPLAISQGSLISFTNLQTSPDNLSGVFVQPESSHLALGKIRTLASSPSSRPTMFEVVSGNTIVESVPVTSSLSVPINFVKAPSGRGIEAAFGTPCYCRGTLITTPEGKRPVETLRIGDAILTASGQTRPIHWIGRRAYDPIFACGNRDVLPILIRTGALGDNLPSRDLTVSPLHAMFIDGLLIPALHLVNDQSILQIQHPDDITYIHVELSTHDILLAEDAPSESFMDDGSRGMFHNADEYVTLYPDACLSPPRYCAPRIEEGPELDEIKRRLTALQGTRKVS